MIHVSVRDLKAQLAKYLLLVKRGERVVVTERGAPIAEFTPIKRHPKSGRDLKRRLAQLVAEGFLVRADPRPLSRRKKLMKLRGKSLSETLIDDRR